MVAYYQLCFKLKEMTTTTMMMMMKNSISMGTKMSSTGNMNGNGNYCTGMGGNGNQKKTFLKNSVPL